MKSTLHTDNACVRYIKCICKPACIVKHGTVVNSNALGCTSWSACVHYIRRIKICCIADNIIYTGEIDKYYNYCYGKLDYRSLKFETEVLDTENYQEPILIDDFFKMLKSDKKALLFG